MEQDQKGEAVIYDAESFDMDRLRAEAEKGNLILCPICRRALLVVVTADDVIRTGILRGVYCERYPVHVHRVLQPSMDRS